MPSLHRPLSLPLQLCVALLSRHFSQENARSIGDTLLMWQSASILWQSYRCVTCIHLVETALRPLCCHHICVTNSPSHHLERSHATSPSSSRNRASAKSNSTQKPLFPVPRSGKKPALCLRLELGCCCRCHCRCHCHRPCFTSLQTQRHTLANIDRIQQ